MHSTNDNLRKKVLTPGLPPCPSITSQAKLKIHSKCKNYTPIPWSEYFDQKLKISTSSKCEFNVYVKGTAREPVIVMLHGGGYSGLTWACLTKNLVGLIDCKVIAIDSRGHGDTITDEDYSLSAEIQANDVKAVLNAIICAQEAPHILLIGHSMGGAIAIHAAHSNLIPNLIGLVVIDVVEGSALDALNCMQIFLRGRPQSFKSVQQAIEWCVRSGQVRNLESARVSMPAQIVESQSDALPETSNLEEVDETNADSAPATHRSNSSCTSYRWRIDLSKTNKYWSGWFQGLSNMFLSIPVAKLLILAGVDRLDKDLTVGQMQGKFQMVVLPKVGHCVHEDSPEKLAQTLASFLVRNGFVAAKQDLKSVMPGC